MIRLKRSWIEAKRKQVEEHRNDWDWYRRDKETGMKWCVVAFFLRTLVDNPQVEVRHSNGERYGILEGQ